MSDQEERNLADSEEAVEKEVPEVDVTQREVPAEAVVSFQSKNGNSPRVSSPLEKRGREGDQSQLGGG